jgi:hypothetical protein
VDGAIYVYGHYTPYLDNVGEIVFRSTDNGHSFQIMSQEDLEPYLPGQKRIAVSPSTAGLIAVLDLDKRTIRRSTNGGVTFDDISPEPDSPVWFNEVDGGIVGGTTRRAALAFDENGDLFFGARTLLVLKAGDQQWTDVGLSHTSSAKIHSGITSIHFRKDHPNEGLITTLGGVSSISIGANFVVTLAPKNNSFNDFPLKANFRLHPTDSSFLAVSSAWEGAIVARGNLAQWQVLNPLSRTWDVGARITGYDLNDPTKLYVTIDGHYYRYDGAAANPTPLATPTISSSSGVMTGPTGSDQFQIGFPNSARNVGGSGNWQYLQMPTSSPYVRRSARSPQTLLAAGSNHFQYSLDNGGTWHYLPSSGYPRQGTPWEANYFADSPHEDQAALFISWSEAEPRTVDAHGDYWVYKLKNYAGVPYWVLTGQGTGVLAPPLKTSQAMAWDPFDPLTVYFATMNGLLMSPDRGMHMYDMSEISGFPKNMPVMAIEVQGDYLYAVTQGAGVYRIRLLQRALISATADKSAVYGGQSVIVTVTMSAAVPTATAVPLTDNSAAVTCPAQVWVPKWSETGKATVSTSPVTAATHATVNATYQGVTKSTSFDVLPPPVVTDLTANPNPVYGGYPCTATVGIGKAVPVSTVINLSDNSAVTSMPLSVTIPANVTTATFSIASTNPATNTTVTVTAKAAVGGSTKTLSLVVRPKPVMWKLELARAVLKGGWSTTLTAFITSPAPPGGAVVALSDNLSQVTMPPSAGIPAGDFSKAVTVKTTAVTTTVTGTISGTYNGVTKTASITLTP